jgi:hypothetical protein
MLRRACCRQVSPVIDDAARVARVGNLSSALPARSDRPARSGLTLAASFEIWAFSGEGPHLPLPLSLSVVPTVTAAPSGALCWLRHACRSRGEPPGRLPCPTPRPARQGGPVESLAALPDPPARDGRAVPPGPLRPRPRPEAMPPRPAARGATPRASNGCVWRARARPPAVRRFGRPYGAMWERGPASPALGLPLSARALPRAYKPP